MPQFGFSELVLPQLGFPELALILVIVLIIFGASRLKDIGSGLGGAISAFRREVKKGKDEEEAREQERSQESEV